MQVTNGEWGEQSCVTGVPCPTPSTQVTARAPCCPLILCQGMTAEQAKGLALLSSWLGWEALMVSGRGIFYLGNFGRERRQVEV